MLFVRSQIAHTGFELTQADDACLLAPQVACFQDTQPLAHDPRRSPTQFSHQSSEPLPRSVIQPSLNCKSHAPIVLQIAICMTSNSHLRAVPFAPLQLRTECENNRAAEATGEPPEIKRSASTWCLSVVGTIRGARETSVQNSCPKTGC